MISYDSFLVLWELKKKWQNESLENNPGGLTLLGCSYELDNILRDIPLIKEEVLKKCQSNINADRVIVAIGCRKGCPNDHINLKDPEKNVFLLVFKNKCPICGDDFYPIYKDRDEEHDL